MKLPLSNRLLACCAWVSPGDRVADIGCDHGYLGIHLLRTGVARSVIEADVREGPLQNARDNAAKFGVTEKMTFCLSDGVTGVPRDFDTLVCAGMGADTIIAILSAAPWLKSGGYRLILQCQSKLPQLRRWLNAAGYTIHRETLAKDGKFIYSIMEVIYGPGQQLNDAECYITPALLESGSPLLAEYLAWNVAHVQTAVKSRGEPGDARWEKMNRTLQQLQELEKSLKPKSYESRVSAGEPGFRRQRE